MKRVDYGRPFNSTLMAKTGEKLKLEQLMLVGSSCASINALLVFPCTTINSTRTDRQTQRVIANWALPFFLSFFFLLS